MLLEIVPLKKLYKKWIWIRTSIKNFLDTCVASAVVRLQVGNAQRVAL